MTPRDRVLASLQTHPGIPRPATMRVVSGKVSAAAAELTPGTEPASSPGAAPEHSWLFWPVVAGAVLLLVFGLAHVLRGVFS
jgi:hypothetical protein